MSSGTTRRATGLEADWGQVRSYATAAAALVSAAGQLSADVIVTDISLPILDGIDATCANPSKRPRGSDVLVTVHSESILVERGLAAGALGYVLKMRPRTNS